MDDRDLCSLDDWELLRRSRRDPDAFGVFYDRHVDDVFGFCASRTASGETAADLTAEVFAAAYIKRSSARSTGAPALAWLYGIARRQVALFHRKEAVAGRFRRKLGVRNPSADNDEARIDALVDLAHLRGPLVAALAKLPQAQVLAVRLRVIDRLSYHEISAALGCSEGAARVRVSRALTSLADELEPERSYIEDW